MDQPVVGGFGEAIVAPRRPLVQITAGEGFTRDLFKSESGGGAAAVAQGMVEANSGPAAGGYAVAQSRALAVYRAGQALSGLWTARWPAAPEGYFAVAGMVGALAGVGVGYINGTFGMWRRIGGQRGHYRLTITAGTQAAPETVTVVAGGVSKDVAIPAGQSTSQTAALIAAAAGWGGTAWRPAGYLYVSPLSRGATVDFRQNVPGVVYGAFSFSTSEGGVVAGTWAEVVAGVANDDVTGFIPRTAWTRDRLDGTGRSRIELAPANLGLWYVRVPYLGAGEIPLFFRKGDSQEWVLTNVLAYPNAYPVPSQVAPAYRVGWAAAAGAGGTCRVAGASGAIFLDGETYRTRHLPTARSVTNVTVDTTEKVVLAFRNVSVGDNPSARVCTPDYLQCQSQTNNRLITIRVYVLSGEGCKLSAEPVWTANGADSALDFAKPAGTTLTGSVPPPIATTVIGASAPPTLDLAARGVGLYPGEAVVVTAATEASTAQIVLSMGIGEG
jgi:hypothetical protein